MKGYPTLNFFQKGNAEPTKFAGSRSKEGIIQWVSEQTKNIAQEEKKEEEKKEAEPEQAAVEVVV